MELIKTKIINTLMVSNVKRIVRIILLLGVLTSCNSGEKQGSSKTKEVSPIKTRKYVSNSYYLEKSFKEVDSLALALYKLHGYCEKKIIKDIDIVKIGKNLLIGKKSVPVKSITNQKYEYGIYFAIGQEGYINPFPDKKFEDSINVYNIITDSIENNFSLVKIDNNRYIISFSGYQNCFVEYKPIK